MAKLSKIAQAKRLQLEEETARKAFHNVNGLGRTGDQHHALVAELKQLQYILHLRGDPLGSGYVDTQEAAEDVDDDDEEEEAEEDRPPKKRRTHRRADDDDEWE